MRAGVLRYHAQIQQRPNHLGRLGVGADREKGRMAPDGIRYVDSWVEASGNRCFQIMQAQREHEWRQASDLVLSPEVRSMQWDAFSSADQLLEAGRQAARSALPAITEWLKPESACSVRLGALCVEAAV